MIRQLYAVGWLAAGIYQMALGDWLIGIVCLGISGIWWEIGTKQ